MSSGPRPARCRPPELVVSWKALAGVALVALVLGCSSSSTTPPSGASAPAPGPSADPASSPPARPRPLPPPGSFVTTIVREGLADAIAVEGEPRRTSDDPRAPAVGVLEVEQLVLQLPDGWRSGSSVLCAWTAAEGFFACTATQAGGDGGPLTIQVHTYQPQAKDLLELWLMAPDTRIGARRLLVVDTATVTWPAAMRIAPGYDTVNDVLRRPPPAGGNYVVAR